MRAFAFVHTETTLKTLTILAALAVLTAIPSFAFASTAPAKCVIGQSIPGCVEQPIWATASGGSGKPHPHA